MRTGVENNLSAHEGQVHFPLGQATFSPYLPMGKNPGKPPAG